MLQIVAGEKIESSFGVALGLSTMAAAGLGNLISDLAGLGIADQIEVTVPKSDKKIFLPSPPTPHKGCLM